MTNQEMLLVIGAWLLGITLLAVALIVVRAIGLASLWSRITTLWAALTGTAVALLVMEQRTPESIMLGVPVGLGAFAVIVLGGALQRLGHMFVRRYVTMMLRDPETLPERSKLKATFAQMLELDPLRRR